MNTRFEERLTSIPEVPGEFGEDGGHFYRYYDTLADEIDDDMVKSLKAQLDGILIYAGLFAGVNSAFLALTLPRMSADPADDTNALLLQLVGGGDRNITSVEDLPSASFSPAFGAFTVNILFSLSLTLALLAAFLAVLGQQWLVYYRKRGGGGAEAQRWEQLRRHLGATRWCLETVLDDILPSLLQVGLVIFCIAFALYLAQFSRWLCCAIAIPMALALACILFMACSAAIDQWCPFKSPLSRILQLIWVPLAPLIRKSAGPFISMARSIGRTIRSCLLGMLGTPESPSLSPSTGISDSRWPGDREQKRRDSSTASLANHGHRLSEPVERLKVIAAKRIMCTSEDTNALTYAATNLQALKSKEDIMWLLEDEEFYDCLMDGQQIFSQSDARNPRPSSGMAAQACAYYSSFLHLVFTSGSINYFFPPHRRPTLSPDAWVREADSKMVTELRNTVSALNQQGQLMQMLLLSRNTDSSALPLFHDLIDAILNTDDSDRLHSWLIGYDSLYQDPKFTTTPLSASMLAYASLEILRFQPPRFQPPRFQPPSFQPPSFQPPSFQPPSFQPLGLEPGKLGDAESAVVPMDQKLRSVCDILMNYHRINADNTLHLIFDVLHRSRSRNWDRPNSKICVYLIEQALQLSNDPSVGSVSNSLGCIADDAIDLIHFLITRGPQRGMPVDQQVEVRDNLSRCLQVLLKNFSYMCDLGMWGAEKHRGISMKISRSLVNLLKLVSGIAKQEAWVLDYSTLLNVLKLSDVIVYSGSNHRSAIGTENQTELCWYEEIDLELRSAFEKVRVEAQLASQGCLPLPLPISILYTPDPASQSGYAEAGPSTSGEGRQTVRRIRRFTAPSSVPKYIPGRVVQSLNAEAGPSGAGKQTVDLSSPPPPLGIIYTLDPAVQSGNAVAGPSTSPKGEGTQTVDRKFSPPPPFSYTLDSTVQSGNAEAGPSTSSTGEGRQNS